jgi:hypothetical protein
LQRLLRHRRLRIHHTGAHPALVVEQHVRRGAGQLVGRRQGLQLVVHQRAQQLQPEGLCRVTRVGRSAHGAAGDAG